MIGNRKEYAAMNAIESKLWWYMVLHGKVLKQIENYFPNNKKINILDAGCGTGGMLQYLKNKDFNNIEGFDVSKDAVSFCNEKGLNVIEKNIENFASTRKYEVIICNDMLYFFEDKPLVAVLKNLSQSLTDNGILIINIHAFNVFYGIHDKAVGSERRYVKSQFIDFARKANIQIEFSSYWSFFLSPLILTVRLWQRFRLTMGWVNEADIQSDVSDPGHFINFILYKIVKYEEQLLPTWPFGSSLFLTFKTLK